MGSEALRNLKSKLHTAQVNKERHQQVVEQLYRKEAAKADEERIAQSMECERMRSLEVDLADGINKRQQRGNVRAINQQQIIQKERMKIESEEQAKREKAQVDAVVEKIEAEDVKEAATRRGK